MPQAIARLALLIPLLAACSDSTGTTLTAGEEISVVRTGTDQVPPGAEREIRALVRAWDASWAAGDAAAFAGNYTVDAEFINPLSGILAGREAIRAQHVFLFAGPFFGSTQTSVVRRIVALTGAIAIVDLDVALTGFRGLPPGLVPTEPNTVRVRVRLVVAKDRGDWRIVAQQMTAVPPPMP